MNSAPSLTTASAALCRACPGPPPNLATAVGRAQSTALSSTMKAVVLSTICLSHRARQKDEKRGAQGGGLDEDENRQRR